MGALRTLLPLVVLFIVVSIAAFVGYQIYLWSNELADRGKKSMEKKHVSFTKDGMKVGVKELNDEDYADKTQNLLVKTWNASSFPAYKSRLWNTQAATPAGATRSTTPQHNPGHASAKSSGSSAAGAAGAAISHQHAPRGETRTSQRSSAGPGAFPRV